MGKNTFVRIWTGLNWTEVFRCIYFLNIFYFTLWLKQLDLSFFEIEGVMSYNGDLVDNLFKGVVI